MEVKLLYPIESVTGSTCSSARFYFRRQKNGKTILCRKPRKKVIPSEKQLATQARFKAVQERVNRILRTVELRVPYEIEWELHYRKKYPVFRHWLRSKINVEMKENAQ